MVRCIVSEVNKAIGSVDDVDVAVRIAAMSLHEQRSFNVLCSPIDLWSQL